MAGMDDFNVQNRTPKSPSQRGPEKVTLECECCFGEYTFENMLQCTNAHLFCLQQHVNEQFHTRNKTTFMCMDSSGTEHCQGVFNRNQLEKLPNDFLKTFDDRVARKEIERAGLQCLSCPECGHAGVYEGDGLFVQCGRESCTCRFCKRCTETKKVHKGKTCEQVAKEVEKKMSATNRTAEAMTNAVLRKCPKCSVPCLKEYGCNKMMCPCGASFCYLCRLEIQDYKHFCRTIYCSHKRCGKCVLRTNDVADDKRARRDAGKAEVSKMSLVEKKAAAKLIDKRR